MLKHFPNSPANISPSQALASGPRWAQQGKGLAQARRCWQTWEETSCLNWLASPARWNKKPQQGHDRLQQNVQNAMESKDKLIPFLWIARHGGWEEQT